MFVSIFSLRLKIIFEVFVFVTLYVTVVHSQPACTPPIQRASIQISMSATGLVDTLWFGFDSTATYGIDEHLCEYEITVPKQSSPFGYRFINIDSHWGESAPAGLGNGVLCDYRHFNRRVQVDTH